MPNKSESNTGSPRKNFEDSDVLRALLIRLHHGGKQAWRTDPEAAELMEHAAKKYAALAKKHGLDPWEAAAAAFEAMRGAATRRADDPWAVVTRAVQITCVAEERGQGLLCSTHQARRPRYSIFHDPERFSDRENPLTDYHRAFTSPDFTADADDDEPGCNSIDEPITDVDSAIADTVQLFVLLGWERCIAQAAVDYATMRLAELPSRQSAYEALRREHRAQAALDLPGSSWTALLRIILGSPDPALASATTGRGVLLRLLIGEPLRMLLMDEDLVLTVSMAAPRKREQP
jgi:hypothetical protein